MNALRKIKIKTLIETIHIKYKNRSKKIEIGKPLVLTNGKVISFGNNVRIKDGYRIQGYYSFAGIDLKPFFKIGNNVNIQYNFSALVADEISIGDDTIIASNVLLTTHNHGIDPESPIPYHAQPLKTAPIHIGSGCWIGEKVTILPGVSIGKKSIIAAGAVVNKDIPDYSIAAGVPAKIIKKYNFDTHKWE